MDKLTYKPVIGTKGELEQINSNMQIIDLTESMMHELKEIASDINVQHYEYSHIYYPWLHLCAKILGEEDFFKVRTNRNKNKITEEEQNILRTKTVGIVGQSTGSQLAYILAQEGVCGRLKLIDDDKLSLSNLNRMRASVTQLGLYKNIISARAIAELDPYFPVEIINARLDDSNIDYFIDGENKVDLVVDACDDIKSKFLLRLACKKRKIPLVMETNDRGRIDIERFDKNNIPIFHGRIKEVDDSLLQDMGAAQLNECMASFLMRDGLSPRMLESLPLIGKTLMSYPQLASETVSGASALATCIRQILLNKMHQSGTFFVDLEAIINEFAQGNNS